MDGNTRGAQILRISLSELKNVDYNNVQLKPIQILSRAECNLQDVSLISETTKEDTDGMNVEHSDFSIDDSVVDEDYIPSSDDDDEYEEKNQDVENIQESVQNIEQQNEEVEDNCEMSLSTRKKRRINTRKQQKELRDHGKESKTRAGKIVEEKRFRLQENCCRKKCFERINEQCQKTLHEKFYECSKAEQNQILAAGITISKKCGERKGRGKTGAVHNRQITAEYCLKIDGSREKVCKRMFQSVYGITKFKIDYLIEKIRGLSVPISSFQDKRGRHEPKNKKTEERKLMLAHIEKYPKYESHYSRRDSQKKYLQRHLNIKILFNEYKKEYQNGGSYDLFREVFKSTGYSFKPPHIDTCKTCNSFILKIKQSSDPNEKNQLAMDHDRHKEMADLAYKSKDNDKNMAKQNPAVRVLVFDLQQVLDTPSLTANVSFYKRLLATYNLTIRDCTSDGDTTSCYMWHEAIGKRGSEEIASCVFKKLQSLPEYITNIITYSDTCGGQNRNINMAAMFSLFVSIKLLLTKCYDSPLPVNPLKKKDLLSILPLISIDCHRFYEKLETSARVTDILNNSSDEDEEEEENKDL